jgi:hypothetical protein
MKNEEQLDEPKPLVPGFRKELEALINTHNVEAGSDTPDFLLADYLDGCLKMFDRIVRERDAWYGKDRRS